MKKILLFALLTTAAHAADWTAVRRIAQVAGCAASLLDAGSTLRPGVAETNPLLGRGRPNAGIIIGVKTGLCAAQIGMAEWRHRRYESSISGFAPAAAGIRTAREIRDERTAAIIGFGQAAAFGGLAVHNMGIRAK